MQTCKDNELREIQSSLVHYHLYNTFFFANQSTLLSLLLFTMPSSLVSLLGRGSDSSSLLDHLKDLKGRHHPLPDFAGDYQKASDRLDILAKRLNESWFPSDVRTYCERDIEVVSDLQLAAALDLRRRSNWCGSPMYFLGGDERCMEIQGMDVDLQKRWFKICDEEGVCFQAGVIHMESRPFPPPYLKKFEDVSNELLAFEMYQSLLALDVVKVNSVDQLTFLIRLRKKQPEWEFQLCIADGTVERQAIVDMAEESNITVRYS